MSKWLNKNRRKLERAGAIALALFAWETIALLLNEPLLLSSPVQVIKRLGEMVIQSEFWQVLAYSALRSLCGFLLAFLMGILLAFAAGHIHMLEVFLQPLMLAIKSVPVASFIIISLIWLDSSSLSVFISFLMVFPVIYTNAMQGFRSADTGLEEMARLYRLGFGRKLLYVYLPCIKPYLLSACNVSLGLAWKSGIAAEVIGIPEGSIGEMLYQAKIYFDTADLFAWTVVIVLTSQLAEKLFLSLLRFAFEEVEKL